MTISDDALNESYNLRNVLRDSHIHSRWENLKCTKKYHPFILTQNVMLYHLYIHKYVQMGKELMERVVARF